MKLRSITLTNVRRFAGQRLHLGGIGDGITVLSQPNEFGKSTVFDAVHALFFERYGSKKAPLKALQPHSGGGVAVSAEIETEAGLFEVSKQWLSKPMARITARPSGRIVASDDEAEAWIGEVIGGGTAGPAGLLWVRQGDAALENAGRTPSEKSEREADRATRRALLGDVLGGEIEAITGGRRMEAVRAKAAAALDRLATTTLRPKAGGPWAAAATEAAVLSETAAELDAKVSALRGDLAARAAAQKEFATLTAPEAEAMRREAYQAAQKALAEAQGQAAQLAQADQTLEMARLAEETAQRELALAEDARERRAGALAAQSAAEKRAAESAEAAGMQSRAAAEAAGVLAQAEAAAAGARAALETARRTETARRAAQEAAALAARVEQAQRHRQDVEAAQAQIATLAITAKDIAAAERADADLRRLTAESGAGAVTLTFDYDGAARVRGTAGDIDGGVPVAVRAQASFLLPGIGRLTVSPGKGADDDSRAALTEAEARFHAALERCGARDLAEARQRLAERTRAEAAKAQAEALLRSVAPDGLAALRAALTQAEAQAGAIATDGATPDTRPVDELAQAAHQAETAVAAARGTAEARRGSAAEAGAAAAAARATLAAAEQALEAAPVIDDADFAKRQQVLADRRHARTQAEAQRETIAATAPNLDRAVAAFDRTSGVIEQAQKTRARLTQEIARLDGVIATLADLGVEERLADTQGRLAAATDRAARFETEARALRRLCDALDHARSAARDQFFKPILAELEPLLHLLHPGSHLVLDDQSLLPTGLARDGTEEPLDILSGGTREQIAILARLAFARLYAKAGQSLPIILDDALVHSDDDRILAMFDALTMVAKGQQILVLTCRQLAFQNLAGEAATVSITAA